MLDVEVWGLGGEATKRQQNVYKKREDIFSEQRRKVLLRANLNTKSKFEPFAMCYIVIEMCMYMPTIFPFPLSG